MKYGPFALGGVLLCWNTGECPRALCPCLYSHLWSFVLRHFPQTPPGADGCPHPTTLSRCFGFSFPECFPPGCVHTSPHLSHTRGQNKERRWGGCCVSAALRRTNENNSVNESFQHNCPPRMLLHIQKYQI